MLSFKEYTLMNFQNIIAEKIKAFRPDLFDSNIPKFHLAYCPERVLPGNVIEELVYNDRIVGGINKQSTERAIKFYNSFVKGEVVEEKRISSNSKFE